MLTLTEISRPISKYSDKEFELQKEYYRSRSLKTIVVIKQNLAELHHDGIFIRSINNFESSPCASVFPDSIRLYTGNPSLENGFQVDINVIDVIWDFWRTEVVQHVCETECV